MVRRLLLYVVEVSKIKTGDTSQQGFCSSTKTGFTAAERFFLPSGIARNQAKSILFIFVKYAELSKLDFCVNIDSSQVAGTLAYIKSRELISALQYRSIIRE